MGTVLTVLIDANVLLIIGIAIHSSIVVECNFKLEFESSPHTDDPEIVEKIEKYSDCTPEQLTLIHEQCASTVHELMTKVLFYEDGLLHSTEYGLAPCERAQIACFSHALWTQSARCVCSVCNHIWFYDEMQHERFVSYFNDHGCKGKIPVNMHKLQFCEFMNQTERSMLPSPCKQEESENAKKTQEAEKQIEQEKEHSFDLRSYSKPYNTVVLMIWTALFAATMSISLYMWIY